MIKIDAMRFISQIQTQLYADQLCFIEELVQNAQRAGATKIETKIKDGVFTICDNGSGISNWEKLFTIAGTGWDAEVQENQNPFGMGFWSVGCVAKLVRVASMDLFEMALIDFDLIRDGNIGLATKIVELEVEPDWSTEISVFLNNDWKNEWHKIDERIKSVARFINVESFIHDGETIPCGESFSQHRGDVFEKVVMLGSGIELSVAPTKYGWVQNENRMPQGVELYCQDRLVSNLELPYVCGYVSVPNGIISLRAPDRKAIVKDGKFDSFLRSINSEIKPMMLSVIEEGTQEQVQKFADAILYYCNVQDVKGIVKFVVDDGTEMMADGEQEVQPDSKILANAEGVDLPDVFPADENAAPGRLEFQGTAVSETLCDHNAAPAPVLTRGANLQELVGCHFWYDGEKDVRIFRKAIMRARELGLPVIIIRNNVERKVAESMSEWKHISELGTMVRRRSEVTNDEPYTPEGQRAVDLLAMLGKEIKVPIVCGDLRTFISVSGFEVQREEEGEVEGIAYGNCIHMSRKYIIGKLNQASLTASRATKLRKCDVQFLLLCLPLLAHEYAHIKFCTFDNTRMHEHAIEVCYTELVERIAKWI